MNIFDQVNEKLGCLKTTDGREEYRQKTMSILEKLNPEIGETSVRELTLLMLVPIYELLGEVEPSLDTPVDDDEAAEKAADNILDYLSRNGACKTSPWHPEYEDPDPSMCDGLFLVCRKSELGGHEIAQASFIDGAWVCKWTDDDGNGGEDYLTNVTSWLPVPLPDEWNNDD